MSLAPVNPSTRQMLLPSNCIIDVCTFGDAKEALALVKTCKAYQLTISKNGRLWRHFLQSDFPAQAPHRLDGNLMYQAYRRLYAQAMDNRAHGRYVEHPVLDLKDYFVRHPELGVDGKLGVFQCTVSRKAGFGSRSYQVSIDQPGVCAPLFQSEIVSRRIAFSPKAPDEAVAIANGLGDLVYFYVPDRDSVSKNFFAIRDYRASTTTILQDIAQRLMSFGIGNERANQRFDRMPQDVQNEVYTERYATMCRIPYDGGFADIKVKNWLSSTPRQKAGAINNYCTQLFAKAVQKCLQFDRRLAVIILDYAMDT